MSADWTTPRLGRISNWESAQQAELDLLQADIVQRDAILTDLRDNISALPALIYPATTDIERSVAV